ncbi:uncharacterized protein LOC136764842 isoform X2 [Amia ocellicauda]|uniref:uncharacterized protein LOC136764842 isoform X2 n=1 Tax=Amia ocellicauda TaxID=2972642 RepID=UPI003463E056
MEKVVYLLALMHYRVVLPLEVVQPDFLSAQEGDTAVLPCSVSPGNMTTECMIPQWFFGLRTNRTANVYPENTLSSHDYKGRVFLHPPDNNVTLSLAIQRLTVGDHHTFYCALSCLLNHNYYRLTGNGTLLFVHGPLQVSRSSCSGENVTLSCQAEVARSSEARLVWKTAGTARSSGQSVTMKRRGTVVIQTQLRVSSLQDRETYTCVLMYGTHRHIAQETVTIGPVKLPMLLYTASLLISFVTLLSVTAVLQLRKRRCRVCCLLPERS